MSKTAITEIWQTVRVEDGKLVATARQASRDMFVEAASDLVRQEGFLLPDPGKTRPGMHKVLEIQLSGGRPLLSIKGELRSPPGLPSGTILFQISDDDEGARRLLGIMLTAQARAKRRKKRVQGRSVRALSDMARRAMAHPGFLRSLDAALKRMVIQAQEIEQARAERSSASAGLGPIIGIDLGTTNTCCAMVKKKGERPFVIPSRRGHNTIPSVVAIDTMGEVRVGHAAKSQMEMNPERTIYGSKRLVGRPFDSPVVRQVRDRFHYEIVAGSDGLAAVSIDGRIFRLDEVSALILSSIRDTAQEYLGQLVDRAVITVPAFYNENQRQAVRRAGELAGLEVERIVNEPTAAALSYGFGRALRDQILMIFDLGGGTFDATVLEIKDGRYQVLATGGDTFLGGVDFDTQLMDHILIEFQLNMGKLPQMERVAYLRVLQAAEFAKRTLSSKNDVDVRLPFIGFVDGKPVDLDVKVTRAQFQDLVRPLVQRTLDTCDAVLAQRSLKVEDVEAILLVGGQTRMPMVRDMLQAHFGKEPLKGVHPDESVATGAALLGHSLDGEVDVQLRDVLPMAIGVGAPGGHLRRVFAANAPLPAKRHCIIPTHLDKQTVLFIPIFQGESAMVDENEKLGLVEVRGIPSALTGAHAVELSLELDTECLLQVKARLKGGAELKDVHFCSFVQVPELSSPPESPPGPAAASVTDPVTDPARDPVQTSGPKAQRGLLAWFKKIFLRRHV